jgi:protein-export membrane protein SecD
MEPGSADAQQAIAESVKVIERRLNDLGIRASVRADGADRIVIQVPQSGNASRVIEVATRPGKLEFRLVDLSMPAERAVQGQPPASAEILYDAEKRPYLIEKRVPLTGREVVDAQPSFDQRTNEPVVSFRFSPNGARRFALLTQENVGRPFAIVLDNVVLSAPVIREPIVGGSGQISGNLTVQQAYDMALLLRSGALPARFRVIEDGAEPR